MQENSRDVRRDSRGRYITTGNPRGHVMSRQRRELFDAYAAEFGGVDTLTPADLADLHQAVDSLLRAKRAKDAVPYKRDAREWLACIRARRASKPEAAPTLGAVLKGAAHV
jgi:hypothetical protein